jgi:hypothetical protein
MFASVVCALRTLFSELREPFDFGKKQYHAIDQQQRDF